MFLCLGFIHSDTSKLRFSEESPGDEASGLRSPWIIQGDPVHLFADDPVVVPRGVGKHGRTCAVTCSPDAIEVGAQMIINANEASLIERYSSFFKTNSLCIGDTPCGNQDLFGAHATTIR